MSQGRSPSGLQRRALSISLPVWELFGTRAFDGQVLGVFNRACILELEGAGPVALVLTEIGDGPLNIVVEGQTGVFQGLAPADPSQASREAISAGSLAYALSAADVWDPRPNWQGLWSHREAILERLPALQAVALRHAPPGSLMDLINPECTEMLPASNSPTAASTARQVATVLAVARKAAQTLAQGWAGGHESVQVGAAALAGLGQGLTPAGDDFLMGLMLWAWLTHPDPEVVCGHLRAATKGRTTALSTAFLQAASRGECSAHWHNLFDVLLSPERNRVDSATRAVLAHGSTSGADTLAGFLYLNGPAQTQ